MRSCSDTALPYLAARSRLAFALGFPADISNRELVLYVMKKNRETLPPVLVKAGAGEGGDRPG